jgi:hypothetical protein
MRLATFRANQNTLFGRARQLHGVVGKSAAGLSDFLPDGQRIPLRHLKEVPPYSDLRLFAINLKVTHPIRSRLFRSPAKSYYP